MLTLCFKITGLPLTKTRNAGTRNSAVTHGWGLVPPGMGIWKGQPDTGNVSGCTTIGEPCTKTLLFVGTDVTFPPCGHNMVAPTWTIKLDKSINHQTKQRLEM